MPSLALLLALLAVPLAAQPSNERPLVVLTFDDAVKSHFTVARPVLKAYGFGATFFVTEGLNCGKKPDACMSWEEIRTLHDEGFEIGNHTRDHLVVTAANVGSLGEQLRAIDEKCARAGVPKPISFAWPGNRIAAEALPALRAHGILLGRRGGFPEFPTETGLGPPYEPGVDHPLLIPSIGVPRPSWTLETFIEALAKAGEGRIAVLQFHGVPETEHPWVDTPRERFEQYMRHLHEAGYRAIALRDLPRHTTVAEPAGSPQSAIERRLAAAAPSAAPR